MAKLGFVVGHPTQFEVPFYRFVSEKGEQNIKVYYFNYKEGIIRDIELGKDNVRSWGIDLINGYKWISIKQNTIESALEILKNNEYIIVNGYTSKLVWILMLLSVFNKRKVGLRLDTVPWNNKSFGKRMYKWILINTLSLFVDIFWTTGQQTTSFLKSKGIKDSQIKVFSYVIDNDWFKNKSLISNDEKILVKQKYGITPENKVILAIVKLVKRESPGDLIKTFGSMKTDHTSLVIVGDGYLREELEQNAKAIMSNNEVVFTGYVPYTELPLLYSVADLYVHPSEDEPWGVSVQEAMACGLPVVASEYVGSAYDLIKEGKNGSRYEYNHGNTMAEAMSKTLKINKDDIRKTNEGILTKWNYHVVWNEITGHIRKRSL